MTPIDDTPSLETSGELSLFETEADDEFLPVWFVGVPALLALGRVALALGGVSGGITVAYDALLVGVAALATDRLFTEADRWQGSDTDWTPNPWWYVVGGGIGVTAVVLGVAGEPAVFLARPTAVVGIFIVGLVCASAVAGPVFLLQRRRRGASNGERGSNDQNGPNRDGPT